MSLSVNLTSISEGSECDMMEAAVFTVTLVPTIGDGCLDKARSTLCLSYSPEEPEQRLVLSTDLLTTEQTSLAIVEFSKSPDTEYPPRVILRMKRPPESHHLCVDSKKVTLPVNHTMELNDNSILALHGTRHAYRVRFDTPSSSTSSLEPKSSCRSQVKGEDDNTTTVLEATARRQMTEEVTCTICMEILTNATVAHPCGHWMCASCATKWQKQKQISVPTSSSSFNLRNNNRAVNGNGSVAECPTCRVGIRSFTRLKSVDNLIWNMVVQGCYFEDEGDVRDYLKKCGRTITPGERKSILRRIHCRKRRLVDNNNNNNNVVVEGRWKSFPPPLVDGMLTTATSYSISSSSAGLATTTAIDLSEGESLDDAICLD